MPNKKAGWKALRKSKKLFLRNRGAKENIQYLLKKARKVIDQKNKAAAEGHVRKLFQAIDKAVQAGIVKSNTGSRKKSRVMMSFNKSFR